ncbi:ankyrin repeat domain-containing protein [Leptospira alexanderi]|uniref:ankyrin repeat domain-containing protein n=1 Tax=Leptospira alexanderi TaxID=100053 RepID=UPI000991490E|nr:ankyrin repeat domain-containing protein [Leptospira alexanderi]
MRILLIGLLLSVATALLPESPDIHTKFLTAVKKGNVAEVEALLKQGAFVDSVDSNGRPAISLAVESAKKTDCKIVKALIAAGASNAIEVDKDILTRYFKVAPSCLRVLLDEGGYDLNACVRTKNEYLDWSRPAFHMIIYDMGFKSLPLDELKRFEDKIDFTKLNSNGGSVIGSLWLSLGIHKNLFELLQYVVSKGVFVESKGIDGREQFCAVSHHDEELRSFEYLLSIEPHLANIQCMYYEYIPIESYIRKQKPKLMNEKLKLLKEAKARAATVPPISLEWRDSAPRCD